MTALSDALVSAQAHALAALQKAYVRDAIDRDTAVERMEALGCTDRVDRDALLAALDTLRELGAAAPAQTNGQARPKDEPATDAQLKLVRRLIEEKGFTGPDMPLTKEQAHEIIDSLKAGTYDPDKWSVPF